jgi:DNA repair exonuclease SbcCD ATPase subunit
MDELRKKISSIDAEIKSYNDSVQLINDNYDELISELETKIIEIEGKIRESDKDIGEWNDMNELFSKTLRYSLLDTLIPHINKSIKYYMNKLNQPYNVEYDQEFKPHIWFDDNEISYSDLSTGQKKTLDIGIIFGVIANVIANVDFNIFFLDELMSNMDSDSRNTMLTLLNDNLKDNRTIFVVNHAEMADDFFEHKIRVKLVNKKIIEKKEPVLVFASTYEKIF